MTKMSASVATASIRRKSSSEERRLGPEAEPREETRPAAATQWRARVPFRPSPQVRVRRREARARASA